MAAAIAPPERRVAPRHQAAFGTVCRLGREIGLVRNISRTGISMLLANPPEPGREMDGVLGMDGEPGGLPVTIEVLHVREVSTGDYLLGARFGRALKAGEMEPFISSDGNDERAVPRKG